ncbi:MFS transporter [Leekyejoonella antrihumi]|uniref:MFS transporter n=2 Tax=Leekyejoonella antrihumi TaxID=1660198 RepID=A0A563EA45_9MICO|nr:MFS transporter [Leekyejoonella antrihumi]
MLPFFVAERHYGYVAAAGITLAATLLSSVVQPVFGVLTDRRPMPWLVPLGLTTAGVGIALSGLTSSYVLTWCAIALSGLGVAAYHPESARLARAASAGSHVGMSWFSLGGNIGFALGPIVVAPVMATMGLGGSPLLLIPALAMGVALSVVLRRLNVVSSRLHSAQQALLVDQWGQFGRLVTVVIMRSIVTFGLNTFLALWVGQHLHASSHLPGEAALAVYFGVGATGTLFGGFLASRFGRVRVIRISYVVCVPTIAGISLAPGAWVYLFIALAALAIYVSFSLHVTLGQDYLPTRVGTASGVTLGLAVSVGGLATPLIGWIATLTSLRTALLMLTVLPAISWVVSAGMREPAQLVSSDRSSPSVESPGRSHPMG